jgi:hypothetical protein
VTLRNFEGMSDKYNTVRIQNELLIAIGCSHAFHRHSERTIVSNSVHNEVDALQVRVFSFIKVSPIPEVEVKLRPTVSRPVCHGVRHATGTSNQFFFLLEIFFRQLCAWYFVAPSLTRGWVCNLRVQLLLGLARAVTLVPQNSRPYFTISFETPPTWRAN